MVDMVGNDPRVGGSCPLLHPPPSCEAGLEVIKQFARPGGHKEMSSIFWPIAATYLSDRLERKRQNAASSEPKFVNVEEAQESIPPGYLGWRIGFLGVDAWATYTFTNLGSGCH
jgi:hypothetical protein